MADDVRATQLPANIEPLATLQTLYIREYAAVGWADSIGSGGVSGPDAALPAPQEPGLDQPPLTLAGGLQKVSLAFAPTTRFVAISCDVAFHYVVGPNPVATFAHFRLPGLTRFYLGVTPGHKLSAIVD